MVTGEAIVGSEVSGTQASLDVYCAVVSGYLSEQRVWPETTLCAFAVTEVS